MSGEIKKKGFSIKEDFTMITILTIPIAVGINIVGDQIVQMLKLPIFLDAIGVVLIAMLAGPWPAVVVGVLTNLVEGIVDNPTLIPFAITSAATGLVAGLFARANWYTGKKWKLVVVLFCLVLSTICTASPISVFFFGGVSGNGGQSMAIAALLASGANIWASVIGTDFWINTLDRAVSIAIAFAVIKVIPDKTLIKYSLGRFFTKKKPQQT